MFSCLLLIVVLLLFLVVQVEFVDICVLFVDSLVDSQVQVEVVE